MLLTSPLSSPLKNPARDVFSPAASRQSLTAQVQALFAGGKVGGMWDMGDTATLFQDAAGATPVTAVTQPIGRVNDKSGNGNHATQPTAINRPLYQVDGGYGSAQFDGINDLLQVAGINLSSTDKVLIGLAFKPNTTALTVAMEYSTTAVSNTGAFYVSLNEGGAGLSCFQVNNGGVVDRAVNASAMAAANTTIVEYIDLTLAAATSKITVRINGAAATLNAVHDGADSPGNFGNYDFFMGARSGGFPSNMNLYRAFIRAGAATAGEQLILENWLRESCGV